jgi:hypothetical protein
MKPLSQEKLEDTILIIMTALSEKNGSIEKSRNS